MMPIWVIVDDIRKETKANAHHSQLRQYGSQWVTPVSNNFTRK